MRTTQRGSGRLGISPCRKTGFRRWGGNVRNRGFLRSGTKPRRGARAKRERVERRSIPTPKTKKPTTGQFLF